jgi:hypothetical protein
LVPGQWPAYEAGPPLAEFADHIELVDYSLANCDARQETCLLTFTWLARGKPSADYTVFIQLWRDGQQAAGFDAPPLANDYPTGLWASQEVILDPHPLDLSGLAPGEYRLLAGLYNFASGERLPAAAGGVPLPDNALDLGLIRLR